MHALAASQLLIRKFSLGTTFMPASGSPHQDPIPIACKEVSNECTPLSNVTINSDTPVRGAVIMLHRIKIWGSICILGKNALGREMSEWQNTSNSLPRIESAAADLADLHVCRRVRELQHLFWTA